MYEFIHNRKGLIQIILAIIFLPFAFFGVDSYFRSSDAAVAVATVGGYQISQGEFNRALRERQEAIQRMTGGEGTTIILVEQHTEVALSLTEEAVVIERGNIVHRARSRDLLNDAATLERLVGLRVSAPA